MVLEALTTPKRVALHQTLAEIIVSSRAGVSKEIARFRREGLIKPQGKGWKAVRYTMVTSMARFGGVREGVGAVHDRRARGAFLGFRVRNLSPRYINSRSSLVVLNVVGSQLGYAARAWSRIRRRTSAPSSARATRRPGCIHVPWAGQTPWMSRREEYLSVINEFLDQE
jgi:hypothetical protein